MLRLITSSSSKVVTYAIRAIGTLPNPIVPFATSHDYSTDAKKQNEGKIIKIIKPQIKLKQKLLDRGMPAIPKEFPFTVKGDPDNGDDIIVTRNSSGLGYTKGLIFTRDFDDGEKIHVFAYKPGCNLEHDDYERDIGGVKGVRICLKVTVSKENGKISEFEVVVSADKIEVRSVSLKEPADSSHPVQCFGPFVVEDEGDLQNALREFLKTRGIKETNLVFFYECFVNRCRKHPMAQLKNIIHFMQEQ
ncbi:hypothetical protein ACS0TY_016329 [Phlomoides rotata]